MKYILLRTLAVLATSYVTHIGVPITFTWQTGWIAIAAAVVIAIINHTIKPALDIVAFPINFFTLGLFSFVINGAMIMLAAQVVTGFMIPSLLMAIYFSMVLSLVNWVLHVFE